MEPINQLKFVFDSGNVVLSLVAVFCCINVVMKTKKELKRAFEYFFASFSVLLLASLLEMNKYTGLISFMQAKWVLIISRFIALFFSVVAVIIMCKMVKRQTKCDPGVEKE